MKMSVSLHTPSPATPDPLGRAVTLTFVFMTCMINIKQMELNNKKHFKIFLKVQIVFLLLKSQLKYLDLQACYFRPLSHAFSLNKRAKTKKSLHSEGSNGAFLTDLPITPPG